MFSYIQFWSFVIKCWQHSSLEYLTWPSYSQKKTGQVNIKDCPVVTSTPPSSRAYLHIQHNRARERYHRGSIAETPHESGLWSAEIGNRGQDEWARKSQLVVRVMVFCGKEGVNVLLVFRLLIWKPLRRELLHMVYLCMKRDWIRNYEFWSERERAERQKSI